MYCLAMGIHLSGHQLLTSNSLRNVSRVVEYPSGIGESSGLSSSNHDFQAYYRDKISYMSAHVLLNLLNELEKRDKMRGLPSILSLFRNEFNKFNNTRALMLDSNYHMLLRLLLSLISALKRYNFVIMV